MEELARALTALPAVEFSGIVHRVTGIGRDALLPSTAGGRWMPRGSDPGEAVLYTSLESDGALAEVASYLAQLAPPPGAPLARHEVSVALRRVLRLGWSDLDSLGVERARYGERDFQRTQQIGAALAFLGFDGLIAPSARWDCDNLIVYAGNLGPGSRLDVVETEEVDWQAFARTHGML